MSNTAIKRKAPLAEGRMWTAEDVALYLSCSTKHVLRLAILGQIPAHNIATNGKRQATWRFEPGEVRGWFRQKRA